MKITIPTDPWYREVKRTWTPDPALLGGRRDRASFAYRAYLPHAIADADWVLSATLAEGLLEAERRCRDLDRHADVIGLDTVARQLLRSESVASSRIEGLAIGHRRLAKAALANEHDVTARSVLGNIAAMEDALERIGGERFSVRLLATLHRRLFEGTPDERHAGVIRERQNWIGGAVSSPRNAEFVPPPPERVEGLLEDLCTFLSRDDVPPILQAAAGHVHFESIHPFADGNGRIGRILIGMVLRRRGVCSRALPPVSLLLAAQADRYVTAMTAYRYDGPDEWLSFFATTVAQAAAVAETLARRVHQLGERWRGQAGGPRPDSATAAIIGLLPSHPVLTIATATAVTGRSDEACRRALNQLEAVGVVRQTSAGRRHRVFEALGLFDLLDSVEREVGDSERAPRATR